MEACARCVGFVMIVEDVTISGYYALLAMVMNTARTPLPADREPGLAAFPRSEEKFRR